MKGWFLIFRDLGPERVVLNSGVALAVLRARSMHGSNVRVRPVAMQKMACEGLHSESGWQRPPFCCLGIVDGMKALDLLCSAPPQHSRARACPTFPCSLPPQHSHACEVLPSNPVLRATVAFPRSLSPQHFLARFQPSIPILASSPAFPCSLPAQHFLYSAPPQHSPCSTSSGYGSCPELDAAACTNEAELQNLWDLQNLACPEPLIFPNRN